MTQTTQQAQLHLRRHCGFRVPGGTYLTSETSEYGLPVDHFLICPPVSFSENELDLSAQGLKLIPADWRGEPEVYDVFDVVGERFYPTVPHFVEEAAHFGTSRRAQPTFQFGLLTDKSRHFFLHKKAVIVDPTKPFDNRLGIRRCPQEHEVHDEQPQQLYQMCLALLWETVISCTDTEKRVFRATLDCGYDDRKPKLDFGAAPKEWNLEWEMGLFMWQPISAIEVIQDPINDAHAQAMRYLDELGGDVPYYLVEE